MRLIVGLLFVLLGVCAAAAPSANRAAAVACRPTDSTVSQTVADLQEEVLSSDHSLLDSLKLSATRASDVSYVTDEKTCAKAVTALSAYLGHAGSGRVYVFKVGTDYLVEDPKPNPNNEYRILQIFDRRWVRKATWLTF